MPSVDFVAESDIDITPRVMQISGMFEVPVNEKQSIEFNVNLPIETKEWNVGLIVGPSGSGKTLIARKVFGEKVDEQFEWNAKSCVDDFKPDLPIKQIVKMCSSVGFNTIPAWLRSFAVLSNGERFRIDLARRMLEQSDPIIVDEFTSVVDRQVAKVASHAVQKTIRKENKKMVAISCHYDVIDWLQPDWIYEPAENVLIWRSVQQRPKLQISVGPIRYEAWNLFSKYHYMSKKLNKAARCFGLFVENQLVAFAGILHFPHAKVKNIKRVSRLVTLPDWQGLGLAFILVETLGAAYKELGYYLHMYPAHPSLIKSFDRSDKWQLRKKYGTGPRIGKATISTGAKGFTNQHFSATFRYRGDKMNRDDARRLIGA